MVCGVDIGGTKLQLAVYDGSLNEIHTARTGTPIHDYPAFLGALSGLVRSADELANEKQAVGLAFPGIVHPSGVAISSNIPCINGQPVIADIRRALSRPVAHINDTRAFTLSEARGGALDGVAVGMGIVLGTGVAGSLCINGRIHRGAQGAAGEYGHLPMPRGLLEKHDLPASRCRCGSDGCAEALLSGPGLVRIAARFNGTYTAAEPLLQDVRQSVPAAVRSLEAYIDCLGYFVSRLKLLLDPNVIVLGGGLSNVGELYRELPAATANYLFDGLQAPSIAAPRFGACSGVRGAAILALEGSSPPASPTDCQLGLLRGG